MHVHLGRYNVVDVFGPQFQLLQSNFAVFFALEESCAGFVTAVVCFAVFLLFVGFDVFEKCFFCAEMKLSDFVLDYGINAR